MDKTITRLRSGYAAAPEMLLPATQATCEDARNVIIIDITGA